MTNLKEVNFGLNQFCGPAVMSALTGKSTDECASVIMSITGRAEVRAVEIKHLIEAFRRLRFDMIQIDKVAYTLFGNLSHLANKQGMYIIVVPKHVVAVEVTVDEKGYEHLYLVDNASKQPLPAEGSARLSQKCEAVYKITERPQPKFIRTDIIIDRFNTHLRLNAHDIYDIDRISRFLGQLTFKDNEELKDTISALNKLTFPLTKVSFND